MFTLFVGGWCKVLCTGAVTYLKGVVAFPPLVLCASLHAMGVADTVEGILAVAKPTRGVCLSTPCNWRFSSPWMSLAPLRGPPAVADCPQPPFNWLAASRPSAKGVADCPSECTGDCHRSMLCASEGWLPHHPLRCMWHASKP